MLFAMCVSILTVGGVAALGGSAAGESAAPRQARLIASDTFHRTIPSGLGRADMGGAYRVVRPGNVSVRVVPAHASIAGFAPGQSFAAELPSVSAADVMLGASFVVPTLPSAYPGLYFGLEMRAQADGRAYRAKLKIGASGQISIGLSRLGAHRAETDLATRTLPLRIRPGQVLNLEGMVTGSTPAKLAVKAWRAGTSVPDWQLRKDDSSGRVPSSGHVAEWAFLSQSGHTVAIQQTQLRVWSIEAKPGAVHAPAPITNSKSAVPSLSPPATTSTPPPVVTSSRAPTSGPESSSPSATSPSPTASSPQTSPAASSTSAASVPPSTALSPPHDPTPAGEVLFAQDYDGLPISDPVSVATERLALGDPTLSLGGSNVARTAIVAASGRGNVMRVTMPAKAISEASGVIIDAKLAKSVDAASIQYDIRFDSGFDWSRGGKLPGLGGAMPNVSPSVAGGCNAGSSSAWSGRGMWITPSSYPSVTAANEWIGYMYDYKKAAACGDNLRTGKALTAGTWHTVKQYYKLNSISASGTPNADGVSKMWLDGVLVRNASDVLYRSSAGLHINYLYWEVFRGGGDSTWASPTEGTVDFDNLVINSS
ncbi:hypothetical protein M6B22_15395 [Jatrophihabitans cynanchi]|uniref:Polysaccharide lyase 14 domain-containing protein n=1 Tax=Jatrophihabitans cynanchi TaxID=2944128 RepID=A0ABY7JTN6_9ACTN|nr:hypothetical protein [Jatrophihabitans sp. SB3-54]WAX55913.1 hypothetical protein M6B22_15395 [Jatrophihabitans sp. SB3-54]